jgi:fatty-acyl-CoA synthase
MMDDMPLLLHDLLDRGAALQPDNLIITKTEGGYHETSYREHAVTVKRLASALSKYVTHGQSVGTFLWNNARHFACYHAIPCMGCVLHTLNVRLSPLQLGYIIQHADDKVILVDADILNLLEAVSPESLAGVELFVICGLDMTSGGWSTTLPAHKCIDFDDFVESGSPTFEWPMISERAACSLCYTSGTTGNPKGVAYSHRSTYLHTQVITNADAFTSVHIFVAMW